MNPLALSPLAAAIRAARGSHDSRRVVTLETPTEQQAAALADKAFKFGPHSATVDSAHGAFGHRFACPGESLFVRPGSIYICTRADGVPERVTVRGECKFCGGTFMLSVRG